MHKLSAIIEKHPYYPKAFCFESFEEMKDVLLRKLTYYFAYRAITPKTIEHILEGYTFHPAWGLTGAQWSLETMEETL